MTLLPFALATATSYVLFEDVRSGYYFETDHALPEIFVPIAIALLGSTGVGLRAAATASGQRAWSRVGVGAAIVLLAFVALTMAKATAGLGGMYQLDSPLTFAVLAVAAAYAVVTVGRVLLNWRR